MCKYLVSALEIFEYSRKDCNTYVQKTNKKAFEYCPKSLRIKPRIKVDIGTKATVVALGGLFIIGIGMVASTVREPVRDQ